MSIAGTPIVRALVSAASQAKAQSKSSVEAAPETDAAPAEASKARRVAWAIVLLLGWGFSYSIGWSKGWTAGAAEADSRFAALNQGMTNLPLAQSINDAPADPLRTTDALETATAAGN